MSAKLYKDIQRKFTEKNIEEPTVYDFRDEEEAPLQGYDWSLIGHKLLMIALSKKDIRFEDVKAHQAKIEPFIHDNQSFGHAFCSFYESIGFQTSECLPYEASVGTAKNILRLAADNVTHDVEGYSSPKIVTSEADLEDN